MHSHLLALPLPSSVRSRLASFCYGPPQINWLQEENFYLFLRHLGPLSDSLLKEIQDRLNALFFRPFFLILQGMGYFHSKGNHGTIWVGTAPNSELLSLKKTIDAQLRGLSLPSEDRSFHPHITLGYYDHMNMQKLGDYLTAYRDYQSESIEVTQCLLLRLQHTTKRTFYHLVEQYSASLPIIEED